MKLEMDSSLGTNRVKKYLYSPTYPLSTDKSMSGCTTKPSDTVPKPWGHEIRMCVVRIAMALGNRVDK